MDLTTTSLSICKEHSHKFAHYFSHKKTLWGSIFSWARLSFSLAFCCSSLVVCCECLLMVLFVGEASQSCLTCIKTLVIWLSCKTPSVPCNTCTAPSVPCMHHNMHHSYTTSCVTHTLHHVYTAPCYLSSHATFHFIKCMLAMWQWLDPTLTLSAPQHVSPIHYIMCYSCTTPYVHHAPYYLSTTFYFIKCMLVMWQYLDPTLTLT